MKKNKIIALLAVVALCIPLTACGEKQQITNVSAVDSSLASATSSKAPASKAPAAKTIDAKSIADALKAAKLPISNIIVYTEKTDTNSLMGRPNQYTSKVNFADTRAEQTDKANPVGGSVEVFANEADAKSRYNYVDAIVKKGGSMFSQYLYLTKNVLLRIDGTLTPTQAKEYQTAFNKIMK